jgi:hypothetical protein
MDDQHYSHYALHKELWDGSLYRFLRSEYANLFQTLATAHRGLSIELHYVGPGLNFPCLAKPIWEPILHQIDCIHLYDIDPRVLDSVAIAIPQVWGRDNTPLVKIHPIDITFGMGHALLDWSRSTVARVIPLAVPDAEYFEYAAIESDLAFHAGPEQSGGEQLSLVISEMAVSATGLGVFWELYEDPAWRSLGITPGFVNLVEQVFNTCVARQHFAWIRRLLAGHGVALVSADVERIYLGKTALRNSPTFARSFPSIFRSLGFQVESTMEAHWQDIPLESAAGIPPHVHRVVCCTASDMIGTYEHSPMAPRHTDICGPVWQGC